MNYFFEKTPNLFFPNMVNHKIKEWPKDFIDKLTKFLTKKKTEIVKLVKKKEG